MRSRRLGSSDLDVSIMSLGSWRTFERLPIEQSRAILAAARDAGITFFDDARYNDETGTAPLPTGWSEVLFGELFRATFDDRAQAVVSNKLWWEFWPQQDATAELDASLGRMGFDYVDLIYTLPLPEGLAVDDAVEAIGALIGSGRARAWGVGNWQAGELASAIDAADRQGVPRPCAAQLPYSLVRRDWVEDAQMDAILRDGDVGLVASFVLAGGVLTGKYQRGQAGRSSGDAIVDAASPATHIAAELTALADRWGVTAANLAFAFALSYPYLASVLFGATSTAQLADNVGSLAVYDALTDDQRSAISAIGRPAT